MCRNWHGHHFDHEYTAYDRNLAAASYPIPVRLAQLTYEIRSVLGQIFPLRDASQDLPTARTEYDVDRGIRG